MRFKGNVFGRRFQRESIEDAFWGGILEDVIMGECGGLVESDLRGNVFGRRFQGNSGKRGIFLKK